MKVNRLGLWLFDGVVMKTACCQGVRFVLSGIADTPQAEFSRRVSPNGSREPIVFFVLPDKGATKKATLLGGIVVTLSGLEPEFAP